MRQSGTDYVDVRLVPISPETDSAHRRVSVKTEDTVGLGGGEWHCIGFSIVSLLHTGH